jgi:dynein heavy chain 1, cytosolic
VEQIFWMLKFTVIQPPLAPANSSTAAAVTFITFVQDLKKKTAAWGPLIELCANGEKTLERFRYQFPDDWLYSDQLKGEWSAYNEILKRKNDSIQEQLGEYIPFRSESFITERRRTRYQLAFN